MYNIMLYGQLQVKIRLLWIDEKGAFNMSSKNWQEILSTESRLIASFYDRRARGYDALVHALSLGFDVRYRKVAVRRLDLQAGDRVLDLGCGTGLDLPLLSQAVGPRGQVVGLDLSPGMLSLAEQRIRKKNCSNVSLVLGNALDLPFRSGSFDAIFCDYLLSTLPAIRAVEEVFRVSRSGARMVFADDLLPSGWFASPLRAIGELIQSGYFNCALPGLNLLKSRLASLRVTSHHGGLIVILSGVYEGP